MKHLETMSLCHYVQGVVAGGMLFYKINKTLLIIPDCITLNN